MKAFQKHFTDLLLALCSLRDSSHSSIDTV